MISGTNIQGLAQPQMPGNIPVGKAARLEGPLEGRDELVGLIHGDYLQSEREKVSGLF